MAETKSKKNYDKNTSRRVFFRLNKLDTIRANKIGTTDDPKKTTTEINDVAKELFFKYLDDNGL